MSTDLSTIKPAGIALPAAFANAKPASAFQGQKIEVGDEGIDGSYGILKYAGKVFSVHTQGVNKPFIRKDDGSARGSVDIVVVRSAEHKAKTYYEGFKEGSKDKPLCWSNNGTHPDAAVPNPPSKVCASCPKNVFGSKITDEGKPAKQCGDHKRTAVVIDPALALETFGVPIDEPILLRIPAASLNDFAMYAKQMDHQGFPLPSLVTRVSFDITKNFPKLKFEALRPLTEAEGVASLALRESPIAIRIVDSQEVEPDEPVTGNGNGNGAQPGGIAPQPAGTTQAQTQTVAQEIIPPQGQQQAAPTNVVQMARSTPQQQAEAMKPDPDAPVGGTNFDASLDEEIGKLLG